ncbi:rubredoxin [Thermogymnomonas acidicola]|uniref:Rubredoxin n=1 Tax=Thermogymnomonas acidicola TaxID=399579 RepID=A0AA37BRU2_9ARCH|nr:Rieske (2Fe-2S) protein [Thermogymnomonas acidicola]GGM76023.1 rubredoxin [Thermogymnomonas acidicola]
MAWKRVVSMKALEVAGGSFAARVDNEVVFIAKSGNNLYAMDAVCSHAKCILGKYDAEKNQVQCFCHKAVFDVKTGRMLEPPFVAPNAMMDKMGKKTFAVRENEGFIEVDLEQSGN